MAAADEVAADILLDAVLDAESPEEETGFHSLKGIRAGKPLNLPLKITVIATGAVTQWKKGSQERSLQKFVVVDTIDMAAPPMLAITYAPTDDVEKDGVLILEQYLYRKSEDLLVLTSKTKLDMGPMDNTRSAALQDEAKALLHPSAELVTISVARTSPVKRKISIEGTVMKDEGMRKVPVKSDPAVYIKTMVISDSQDKIQVSLWRDMAHEPFSVGQQVRLTNMLVNVYKDVVSLNSSKDPTVTIAEAPAQVSTVTFEGLVSVTADEAVLKAVRNGIYQPFTIPAAVFTSTSVECRKASIRRNLPFVAKVTSIGCKVSLMEIL